MTPEGHNHLFLSCARYRRAGLHRASLPATNISHYHHLATNLTFIPGSRPKTVFVSYDRFIVVLIASVIMTYLSHSASLHTEEKILLSNRRILTQFVYFVKTIHGQLMTVVPPVNVQFGEPFAAT